MGGFEHVELAQLKKCVFDQNKRMGLKGTAVLFIEPCIWSV